MQRREEGEERQKEVGKKSERKGANEKGHNTKKKIKK